MTLTCWLQCIRSEWTLALQTICRLHNENPSNFQTYWRHRIWTNQKSCCLLKYWPSAMSTYEKISAQLLLSVRCSSRVVASTQSFKYQYEYLTLKYQYLSLKYQYPCLKYKYQYFGSKYQYHCTSTCSQYHAAASYRLVQNLKPTTKQSDIQQCFTIDNRSNWIRQPPHTNQ